MAAMATPLIRTKTADLDAAGVHRVPRVTGVEGKEVMLDGGQSLPGATVIWCTGFVEDYPWLDIPALPADWRKQRHRGIVDALPGLYLLGKDFIFAATSDTLPGVSRDAKYLSKQMAVVRTPQDLNPGRERDTLPGTRSPGSGVLNGCRGPGTKIQNLAGMHRNMVRGKALDELAQRQRLVDHEGIVRHQQRRHQHGGGLVVEVIGDVAENGGLVPDMLRQLRPVLVLGDDPLQVPGIEADPVIEAGAVARDNTERHRRDRRVNAQDVGQNLIRVPAAVRGDAEAWGGRCIQQTVIGCPKFCCIHAVVPFPSGGAVTFVPCHGSGGRPPFISPPP